MALSSLFTDRHFSSIKPGFFVVSQVDGVANVDDFLRRLSTSVLRLNAYDASAAGWLYIASVDVIANAVLKALSDKGATSGTHEVICGRYGHGRLLGYIRRIFWPHLTTIAP